MGASYMGPSWYWVENVVGPCFVEKDKGGWLLATRDGVRYNIGRNDKVLAHIPRPAQRPVVDWSVMPAWAKWVAMDEDGNWCWFSERPSFVEGGVRWFLNSHKVSSRDFGLLPDDFKPTYTGDWRNSLVERPE